MYILFANLCFDVPFFCYFSVTLNDGNSILLQANQTIEKSFASFVYCCYF